MRTRARAATSETEKRPRKNKRGSCHVSTTQKIEFTVHRFVAEDALWASSEKKREQRGRGATCSHRLVAEIKPNEDRKLCGGWDRPIHLVAPPRDIALDDGLLIHYSDAWVHRVGHGGEGPGEQVEECRLSDMRCVRDRPQRSAGPPRCPVQQPLPRVPAQLRWRASETFARRWRTVSAPRRSAHLWTNL